MKVAVWIDNSMMPTLGGGFSYTSKLVKQIDEKTFDPQLEICFIGSEKIDYRLNKSYTCINIIDEKLSLNQKLIIEFSRKFRIFKKLKNKIQAKNRRSTLQRIHKQVKQANIDIVYYLAPMQRYIPKFPFISTNWDLGHLTLPPFPEITEKNELQVRTKWYNKILPEADYIFTESEAGKNELINLLSIPERKIKVVPIFPGNLVEMNVLGPEQKEILKKFKIEQNSYYIYPAQFWKHKNHERLVFAFAEVFKDNPNLKLILSGSDKGELDYILNCIDTLGISENIKYVGFLSNEELYVLYNNALALVFPSLLGPTNMPPLEARAIGCPILCSDFLGHREQLGEGAIYFNPEDINSLTESMKIVLDENKRNDLLKHAEAELKTSKFKVHIAVSKIEEYVLSMKMEA
ncbi:glycosyltransferase family 1 protein [Winogradskyella sp.]|uniref:glycosyltransferase family 4 protein n=1 Tax=Winogradskyella sp. TaxID=1883156 RepID=UPI00260A0938|nr:glycosyltransferase family 1 protein [Winogradskyella sp.]